MVIIGKVSLRETFIIGDIMIKLLQHDVTRLTSTVFQCNRCKKYFQMNKTFRIIITEQDAIKKIEYDNTILTPLLNKFPELKEMSKSVDFYNTEGYLENLSIKDEICWR